MRTADALCGKFNERTGILTIYKRREDVITILYRIYDCDNIILFRLRMNSISIDETYLFYR